MDKEGDSSPTSFDQDKLLILDLEAQLVQTICWMYDKIMAAEPFDLEGLLRKQLAAPAFDNYW